MQKKVPEVKSSFWWDLGEVFLCQIQKYNKESVIAPTTIEAVMSTMIIILFVSILWCSPAGDPDFIRYFSWKWQKILSGINRGERNLAWTRGSSKGENGKKPNNKARKDV